MRIRMSQRAREQHSRRLVLRPESGERCRGTGKGEVRNGGLAASSLVRLARTKKEFLAEAQRARRGKGRETVKRERVWREKTR